MFEQERDTIGFVLREDKAGDAVDEVERMGYRERNQKHLPWTGVKILLS